MMGPYACARTALAWLHRDTCLWSKDMTPDRLTPDGPEQGDSLIPARAFAARLGIQRRTLGHRLRDGSVPPPVRLRGRLYWLRSVVERFFSGLGAAEQA